MTRQEFLDWPRKAVTLLGMSGVGKTHLANSLPKDNWFHYSGDYRIGTKYLSEPILDNIKRQAMQVKFLRDLLRSDSIYIANNVTVHNLEPVATFLGKLGNPELGGLPLDEFKRRQRLHALAEAAAMRDVADFIDKAHEIYGYDHFLNDAGGSIVELDDRAALQCLIDNTVILYLKVEPEMEEALIRRAISNPKPLYFREEFLDRKLAEYLQREGLA
ncbi:MAG TPA: ATPase, partial [Chromatiales bacterium]|nr:ATPase [Chromatiales bacterium]